MSDALCGPSNPLQQFKQQTQLDRTLQQDRLTSRHASSQGFRSHDPRAGRVDPEFEAFQAGAPLPDLPQFHHQQPTSFAGPSQTPGWASDFQRMQISSPPPPSSMLQYPAFEAVGPTNGSWAQQSRDISAQRASRPYTSTHSPQAFQQMARYGASSFQPQFVNHPGFTPTVQSKGKEPLVEQYDDAAFERAFDQAKLDIMDTETVQQKVAHDNGVTREDVDTDYDTHVDVALPNAVHESLEQRLARDHDAQALEDANRAGLVPSYEEQIALLQAQSRKRLGLAKEEAAMRADNHGAAPDAIHKPTEQRTAQDFDVTAMGDVHRLSARVDYEEQLRLLEYQNRNRLAMAREEEDLRQANFERTWASPEETIAQTEQTEAQTSTAADDDALAATARDLLQKLEDNQTDKFKNSQFLNLMRRLRDREMRVEGDQMVETGAVRAAPFAPVPADDSAYGSTLPTLVLPTSPRSPSPDTYPHLLPGHEDIYAYDHWESPYR